MAHYNISFIGEGLCCTVLCTFYSSTGNSSPNLIIVLCYVRALINGGTSRDIGKTSSYSLPLIPSWLGVGHALFKFARKQ